MVGGVVCMGVILSVGLLFLIITVRVFFVKRGRGDPGNLVDGEGKENGRGVVCLGGGL